MGIGRAPSIGAVLAGSRGPNERGLGHPGRVRRGLLLRRRALPGRGGRGHRQFLRAGQWDGDDSFDIILDSFNDDETALKFSVLPLGALVDEEVQNDASPSGDQWPVNREWNGFWEARTHRTEDGWSAEIRIPWSSLGFRATDGRVVMGLIAGRYIARLDERHVFPATLHPDIENAEFKPSLAQDVEIRGVESGPPLYVSPYVLSGLDRTRDLDLGPAPLPRRFLRRWAWT